MIPKAKYRFHAAAILFYIVQKNYLNESCRDFEGQLPYIISGPYKKCQLHLTSLCIQHIVSTDYRKWKKQDIQTTSVGIILVTKFHQNQLNGSNVVRGINRHHGDFTTLSFLMKGKYIKKTLQLVSSFVFA
jgi:hypothetical protein